MRATVQAGARTRWTGVGPRSALLLLLPGCVLVTGEQRRFRDEAWEDVSVGSEVACGVRRDDGTLHCWGEGDPDDPFGLLSPPEAPPYVQVSVGTDHACALLDTGEVACWGEASGEATFTEVHVGDATACGLTDAGKVACWGAFERTDWSDAFPDTYIRLTMHALWVCALDEGGAPACAVTNDGWDPLEVPEGLGPFVDLAASSSHGCGIHDDGSLSCWGSGPAAEAPKGTYGVVAAGGMVSCGITEELGLGCWGSGDRGQLHP